MRNLYLFPNNYPYGNGETFLADELQYLSQAFDNVYIVPLWVNGNKREIPYENVQLENPILGFNPKKKIRLLLSGIFNLSPLPNIFNELHKSKHIECRFKRKLWLIITSVLITRNILSSKKFKKTVKKMTPNDLCYFYWGDTTANALPFLKRKNKNTPKSISRFHGSDLYHHAKGYIPFRNRLLEALDIVCTISKNGADYLERIYPNIHNKLIISRLGSKDLGIENFAESDCFRILTCSNIIQLKRLDLLANALKLIKNKRIIWTHIGDGPMKSQVLEITKSFGDNISVDFKGLMKHDKLLEFIKNSSFDVFINTSSSEGVPVSIMEAISFGIPVISTDVGGTSEIVNANTGFLISKDTTPEQLKDKITEFLSLNKSIISQLRASARKEWELHWNMCVNYRKFTDFISNC